MKLSLKYLINFDAFRKGMAIVIKAYIRISEMHLIRLNN